MAEYKVLLTLKKIGITLAIYGLPALLAYFTDAGYEWSTAFSIIVHAVIDYLKHK